MFGGRFNPSYPDLVVYIDEDSKVQGIYLLWKGKLTAHLYGARNVWVVLFWDLPLNPPTQLPAIEARITTLAWASPNPLALIFQSINAPAGGGGEDKETGSTVKMALTPLGDDDPAGPRLHYALARFPLGPDTSNRISIYPMTKEHTTETRNIWKPENGQTVETDKLVSSVGEDWSAKAHSIHAEFSNSRDSWVAGTVAGAITMRTRNTALGEDVGDNFDIGGYVFLKVYLGRRPTVRIGPLESRNGSLYRSAWSAVLGTNVTGDDFNELVLGIGWSHVLGRMGFFAGVNSIAPSDDFPDERKERVILGAEYTF